MAGDQRILQPYYIYRNQTPNLKYKKEKKRKKDLG
jgi:hypothetical protein